MGDLNLRGEQAKRVLAVDDDPDILNLVATQLELDGYVVEKAANGEACLAAARANPPDLIILDLIMPRMAGEEVVRQLRGDHSLAKVPIIMLTAVGDRLFRLVALSKLGVDSYMVKPFVPDKLSAKAHQILCGEAPNCCREQR